LSVWKKFGDLIEIGQTSQRCICEIDNKGTIAAARRAGDSRSPPDVERADTRSAFTVGQFLPLATDGFPALDLADLGSSSIRSEPWTPTHCRLSTSITS
jgi:hypothetical protein